MINMKAAEKLSEYVKRNNIRVESIAEATNIPKAVLQKMLDGKMKIKAEEFLIIIQAINLPLSYFMGG